jgi:hypothetical protein
MYAVLSNKRTKSPSTEKGPMELVISTSFSKNRIQCIIRANKLNQT